MLIERLKYNIITRLTLSEVQFSNKKEVDSKMSTGYYKSEEICCPLCSNCSTDYLTNKGQFYLPVNVVICKKCGLTYLNPRWNKKSYLDFYSNHYYGFYNVTHVEQNTLRIDDNIIKRIPNSNKQYAKNILDIGSGKGDNLLNFKNHFSNLNLFAIEPSIQCQNILQKNNIQVISRDVDFDWETEYIGKFDIIIMRHVLEHFMNPINVLIKVRKTLK